MVDQFVGPHSMRSNGPASSWSAWPRNGAAFDIAPGADVRCLLEGVNASARAQSADVLPGRSPGSVTEWWERVGRPARVGLPCGHDRRVSDVEHVSPLERSRTPNRIDPRGVCAL